MVVKRTNILTKPNLFTRQQINSSLLYKSHELHLHLFPQLSWSSFFFKPLFSSLAWELGHPGGRVVTPPPSFRANSAPRHPLSCIRITTDQLYSNRTSGSTYMCMEKIGKNREKKLQ